MAKNKRHFQLEDQIQEEVSKLLYRTLQKKQFGMLTVTAVDVSDDYTNATIWISVMAAEVSDATIVKGLRKVTPKIQAELNKLVPIKKVPKIKFQIDNSSEYVDHISKILEEINEED